MPNWDTRCGAGGCRRFGSCQGRMCCVRFVLLGLSIAWIVSAAGCATCQNTYDDTYAAYGGSQPRADMVQGRVGSRFAPAGGAAESAPVPGAGPLAPTAGSPLPNRPPIDLVGVFFLPPAVPQLTSAAWWSEASTAWNVGDLARHVRRSSGGVSAGVESWCRPRRPGRRFPPSWLCRPTGRRTASRLTPCRAADNPPPPGRHGWEAMGNRGS